ncbi:MAG TPA: sulfite exporter TauE/SafE family protein [Spirochaetota bacterium]|nr:sulfite exporter TauE/SafE family protein [Spirochaetota bacterium]
MPEFSSILALFGLGIIIGAVSPTFGIGGGLLTVPVLLLIFGQKNGFSGDTATATSLGVILFTSLSGTIAYLRERRIDYRTAASFMLFAIPGSVAGALFSRWMGAKDFSVDPFQYTFAVFMIAIALYKLVSILAFKRGNTAGPDRTDPSAEGTAANSRRWDRHVRLEDKRGQIFEYRVRLFPGIFIAFIGGFIGALLGLGGGVIYVPVLTMVMGVPAAVATATSTFTILVANPFAIALRFGSVRWEWVAALAAGTVISAGIVPRFLHRVKSEWILTGFWGLAIFAALRILLKMSGVLI